MSDLTGWCVVADERIVASCLTWEDAVQITCEAADTGLYDDVHVCSSHAAKFYVDMEKSNELET